MKKTVLGLLALAMMVVGSLWTLQTGTVTEERAFFGYGEFRPVARAVSNTTTVGLVVLMVGGGLAAALFMGKIGGGLAAAPKGPNGQDAPKDQKDPEERQDAPPTQEGTA